MHTSAENQTAAHNSDILIAFQGLLCCTAQCRAVHNSTADPPASNTTRMATYERRRPSLLLLRKHPQGPRQDHWHWSCHKCGLQLSLACQHLQPPALANNTNRSQQHRWALPAAMRTMRKQPASAMPVVDQRLLQMLSACKAAAPMLQ
jgi:hypothetical protein